MRYPLRSRTAETQGAAAAPPTAIALLPDHFATVYSACERPGLPKVGAHRLAHFGLRSAANFRQMKDPTVVSFSPMFHFTEQEIPIHLLYCVLALMVAVSW